MRSIQNSVERNLVRWFLEEESPSVRYFALRDLLGKREDYLELQAAKAAIPSSKVITRIFSKQKSKGYWGTGKSIPSQVQIVLLADNDIGPIRNGQ